ncbi:MAG: GreA/GreB family elongation factor [Candidatus Sumerlaeia bacterium]|nr:GreA/GreB family elongation factor [Candidatus Sumerlaeia bacterium]
MQRAQIAAPRNIPADVITMNSKVWLTDLTAGGEFTHTLCFPAEANLSRNRISVPASRGTALSGWRVGDTVEWQVPSGLRRMKIEAVLFQPEAAGRFDL